ncbi:MAG: bi-domain-containing oxidoreductase [Acidimicrobiales bacterium]
MKQVVQSAGGGAVEVVDSPAPQMNSTSVLVRTEATLISAGTERAVTQLAQANLLEKAKARPDLVRQVISKAKTDGLKPTLAAVRSRLNDDLALGYSGAGTIIDVGSAVSGLHVGQRVATGGSGFASHAEFQAVPWVLAAPIPDTVTCEQASFATVAAVGLHGLRLGEVRLGAKVLVVGLGLIGQLTSRMAVASGCDVMGIDLDQSLIEMAQQHGVHGVLEAGADTTAHVTDWSRGRGADLVVITAGASGHSGIIKAVPARCRDRATVVAVGDIGLDLNRNDFYHKELDLKVARSYGPGRYDRSYEEWGVDYPIGHVRWTEGRNLEAVIDLIASGRLDVDDLVSHRFDIGEAEKAYAVLDDKAARPIGVVLTYPGTTEPDTTVTRTARRPTRAISNAPKVGILGAGGFVRSVILLSLKEAGYGPVVHIASASGVSASRLAEREGISRASSDPYAVINDPEVEVLVVATPHSSHAEYVVAGLDAGKHVYCEKPLAITEDQLADVAAALERTNGRLYVGFNRRYSPMAVAARDALAGGSGPIHVHYRVNAGPLSPDHWYSDRREGGRLLGEVCHFIDLCAFLTGDQDVVSTHRVGPTVGHDTYHLLLEYADGSSASILYVADGHPTTPKELVEINGRHSTIVIDNFHRLTFNNQVQRIRPGKGFVEGLASAFTHDTAVATSQIALRLSAPALR